MIIQSLVSLYDRLSEDTEINISSLGYADQKISFAFVLDLEGNLLQIKDLRHYEGTKLKANMFILPSIERSGSGYAPQFMWDNTQYVLGAVAWDDNKINESKKKKERALGAFNEFKRLHNEYLLNVELDESKAILKFLNSWNPDKAEYLENWKDIADTNLIFIIDGQRKYVHEYEVISSIWSEVCSKKEKRRISKCLLTGEDLPLARIHPMIKNVDGAQSKGAAIASFNKDSFCSYQKEQSYNSPINIGDTFKYTTSLNYLLRRNPDNKRRLRIGDTTTVFWTECSSLVEDFMGYVFDPHEDIGDTDQIRLFLSAVRKGVLPADIEEQRDCKFFILGLAPNNSRLAIRFWYVCTVEVLMQRIGTHFNNLDMERSYDKYPLNPGIWHLLKETARETKNISPVLGGALMRSILEGSVYPQNLFNGVLNRIRADQRITYLRAAICKAVLIRNYKMEVPMSLDMEKKDISYLLGRLFAVLEKAQQDANPRINATIKDRFYGSASATPASVFPRLLRLSQHHISKSDYGYVSDNRILEIMENIEMFPEHMDLKSQGLFAIGYYHQKNSF